MSCTYALQHIRISCTQSNHKAYPQGIYTRYFTTIWQYWKCLRLAHMPWSTFVYHELNICLAHMPCSTFRYQGLVVVTQDLEIATRHIHKTYIQGASIQYDNLGSALWTSICNTDLLCHAYMQCSTFVYQELEITTRHIHKAYIQDTSIQLGSSCVMHICHTEYL